MIYHGNNLRKGRYSEKNRIYLVTAVTHKRKHTFSHFQHARILSNEFRILHESSVVNSLAWVVMPEHFHWLFELHSKSLSAVVLQAKSKSAYNINLNQNTSGQIWQKGFHDRALRDEKEIQNTARYIVANPIRAGLVRSIGDYPHWDAVWL